MKPKAICAFCGMGGGTLGLIAAGFEVILAIDISPDALRAHRQFCPCVPTVQADLSKESIADVMLRCGINPATFEGVIFCSPPCQGFADCGKRNPDAMLNNLMQVPAEAGEACPHAWIVIENVRGLLSLRNRPRLLRLLDALSAQGRAVPTVKDLRENYVLDAQDFGVPQHRERVIIIAPPAGIEKILPPKPLGRL